jgi:hypothetical protein
VPLVLLSNAKKEGQQLCSFRSKEPKGAAAIRGLKLYYPFLNCGAAQNKRRVQALPMASKEKDVFYLKLQWMSAKDAAQRKELADKIKQTLYSQQKK